MWLDLTVAALLGNAIPSTLFGVAEQTVDSTPAGAITWTTPRWTLLFAVAFRQNKRLGRLSALGVVLGFAGALLILAPWRSDSAPLPGVLPYLAASASDGPSDVHMGPLPRRSQRATPRPVHRSVDRRERAARSSTSLRGRPGCRWGSPTPLRRCSSSASSRRGLAHVLNNRIITDDGPVLASTVTDLSPVVAVLARLVVLGEPVSALLLLGVGVVLLGVGLTRRAGS